MQRIKDPLARTRALLNYLKHGDMEAAKDLVAAMDEEDKKAVSHLIEKYFEVDLLK